MWQKSVCLSVISVFAFTSCSVSASSENAACGEYWSSEQSSDEAAIRTFFLPILLENVEGDLRKRLEYGDSRFLRLSDRARSSEIVKGVPNTLVCVAGYRDLDVSGFVAEQERDLYERFRARFEEYVDRYNQLLLIELQSHVSER